MLTTLLYADPAKVALTLTDRRRPGLRPPWAWLARRGPRPGR